MGRLPEVSGGGLYGMATNLPGAQLYERRSGHHLRRRSKMPGEVIPVMTRYAPSRNHATACRSPSSTGYCGSYPKASRAREMSASESRMSPARVAS